MAKKKDSDAEVAKRWRGRLAKLKRERVELCKVHVRKPTKKTRAAIDKIDEDMRDARKVIARHTPVTGVSDKGVRMVADFEGFRGKPYRDAVGVWTIGYGETRGIGRGTKPWSKKKARDQLCVRLDRDYLAPVLKRARGCDLHLSQCEADALASLVYNLGPGILEPGRTMGDALASHDRRRIADAFLVYNKAGGYTLPGLVRRRRAERDLFLS